MYHERDSFFRASESPNEGKDDRSFAGGIRVRNDRISRWLAGQWPVAGPDSPSSFGRARIAPDTCFVPFIGVEIAL